LVNAIAITPIFGDLDCPQNERPGTTTHDCEYEKVFAHGKTLRRKGDPAAPILRNANPNLQRRSRFP
jgi:hypothetical protein